MIMLEICGELCEVGDLDSPEGSSLPGFRILTEIGREITVTGLTREEARGLGLFVNVRLAVVAA
jgi:hypothetical protein